MSTPFIFKDSRPDQIPDNNEDITGLLCAIDKLNDIVLEGKMEILSISGKRQRFTRELPPIISYKGIRETSNQTSACFDVSHYIGSYTTRVPAKKNQNGNIVTIEIKPRWGNSILEYLLQYTTGIYMPSDAMGGIHEKQFSAEWMLVLLWKSVFNQALRRNHIPKEYRQRRTNDRFFKGRLDVHRQIRENIADQSKFCCVHAPLTIDTTINQTIRYVFRILARNPGYARLLNDIAGYDERLASFGVKTRDVRPEEINRIRYSRMSEGYRPLMQVGKAIIRRFAASTSEVLPGDSSFFMDISEIWENYLQAILTRYLPPNYRIINPNETGGQWLISGQLREIRPDLIIENEDGIPIAILDAKFKNYTEIGKFARDGVSREDLYQMMTYLYHYGELNAPLIGLFISPGESLDDRIHSMSNRSNHTIGVLNFNLEKWNADRFDIKAIRAYEEEFVARMLKILKISMQ